MKYDLSILICSLPNRLHLLYNIYQKLNNSGKSVQILSLCDNKSISVGEKRNHLITMAQGRYVTFVDDDDSPEDDYIFDIIEGIKSNADVITYLVDKRFNGEKDRTQKYSREYGRNHRSPDKKFNLMLPDHLCVWKKEVIKEKFYDKSLGEDWMWAQMMIPHYRTEHHIDKVLYTYNFSKETTETQKR